MGSFPDHNVQYAWPPQDPTRMPNPPPISSSSSAFIYGEGSLNPNLRPSNAALRQRTQAQMGSSSGSSSGSRSSSPERYLSDYDDDNAGPRDEAAERDDKARRMNSRMRRGSEGWEVRPTGGWNGQPAYPAYPDSDPQVQAWMDQARHRPAWLEQGRYNVYEPTPDDIGYDDEEDER